MNLEEKVARFRLLKTPRIGRVAFLHLLTKFGSAKNAIENLSNYSEELGSKYGKLLVSNDSIINFLDKCAKSNVKIIFFDDVFYSKELLSINDFPPVLFVKGNINLLNKSLLAVVGSRSASLQGLSFTKKLIKDLNIQIVSGFARGIDTAAHEASLQSGTIAVLGSGINVVYPQENNDLYKKILDNNGLIISEIGLNDTPKSSVLSYRNRIISGLAKGIVVIEAAMNSGSLVTARYAADQGKNVFAVPGHPYDIRSSGTNYLLKNGAILVRNSSDILSEFNCYRSPSLETSNYIISEVDLDDVKKFILLNLSSSPVTVSEITSSSNYTVSVINAALAELELADLIYMDQNFVIKI